MKSAECKADAQEILVESPMAKPANHDPSATICWDPDPEAEYGSDPETPKLDPPMFVSDPDRDPSALVAPGAVIVGLASFDDFWLQNKSRQTH